MKMATASAVAASAAALFACSKCFSRHPFEELSQGQQLCKVSFAISKYFEGQNFALKMSQIQRNLIVLRYFEFRWFENLKSSWKFHNVEIKCKQTCVFTIFFQQPEFCKSFKLSGNCNRKIREISVSNIENVNKYFILTIFFYRNVVDLFPW